MTMLNPEYEAIRLQMAQTDLLAAQQDLQFLRDKHEYEMRTGKETQARATQQQIFNQQMQISQQRFLIDQANRNAELQRQETLRATNMDIAELARDPGDRAAYVASRLANSDWNSTPSGDLRTTDSKAPLENVLRLRESLMQPAQQFQYTGPTEAGINLGALQMPTANPAAMPGQMNLAPPQVTGSPDMTPGYTTTSGYPDGAGVNLSAEEIMAGAQWAPTKGFEPVAGVAGGAGIDLTRLMQNPDVLPQRRKGGVEDKAFIAGEAGPEIVIPLKDGKNAILNEEQAASVGINLSKLTKMAAGGIFDAFADRDTGMADAFLDRASSEATAGTPFAGQQIPDPVFASSPGFDPIVLDFMAAIRAMQTGLPVQSYKRSAARLTPRGVGEAPIRRTA